MKIDVGWFARFGALGFVCLLWTPGIGQAQYCGVGGGPVCDPGLVCEPVSATTGLCCPDDPMTGQPPVCIGPSGPPPATVLASDLIGLLSLASDPGKSVV